MYLSPPSSYENVTVSPHEVVRVIGNLRDFETNQYLQVLDIAVVKDFNEITHHLLDIVYVHLQRSVGPVPVRKGYSICYKIALLNVINVIAYRVQHPQ